MSRANLFQEIKEVDLSKAVVDQLLSKLRQLRQQDPLVYFELVKYVQCHANRSPVLKRALFREDLCFHFDKLRQFGLLSSPETLYPGVESIILRCHPARHENQAQDDLHRYIQTNVAPNAIISTYHPPVTQSRARHNVSEGQEAAAQEGATPAVAEDDSEQHKMTP